MMSFDVSRSIVSLSWHCRQLALCGGLIVVMALQAQAGIVFDDPNGAGLTNVVLRSGTDFDEVVGGSQGLVRTGSDKMITLSLDSPIRVTAESIVSADFSGVNVEYIPTRLMTKCIQDGTPCEALLEYTIDVGGSFAGEGDDAVGIYAMTGRIGDLASHFFSDDEYQIFDGQFDIPWIEPTIKGSMLVRGGENVTPRFDSTLLTAFSDGNAEMVSSWSTATITMKLRPLFLEEPIGGDVNSDGSADFLDYQIIRENFNSGTTLEEGDLDFSGKVDLRDFRIWKDNAFPRSHAVPEPSAMALVGIGVIAFGLYRGHRRST